MLRLMPVAYCAPTPLFRNDNGIRDAFIEVDLRNHERRVMTTANYPHEKNQDAVSFDFLPKIPRLFDLPLAFIDFVLLASSLYFALCILNPTLV